MATTPTKSEIEVGTGLGHARAPSWPLERKTYSPEQAAIYDTSYPKRPLRPSGGDALQALLAFSALHQQVRQRRALAAPRNRFDAIAPATEFEPGEQFVLDEVLQLVAERAIAITGADGLGIALAENNEIVLRASAGAVKPGVGARIQRDSSFSGASFRAAQIMRCDDTETDDRVNLHACRQLGARSMVAVPLCGRRRVIGLLEAFSAQPFAFNDSDIRSLELLAELVVGALKPQDEDRFAEAAQVAEADLAAPAAVPAASPAMEEVAFHKVVATPLTEPQIENGVEGKTENAFANLAAADIDSDLFPSFERDSEQYPEQGSEDSSELRSEQQVEGKTVHAWPHDPVRKLSANRHPGIALVLGLVVMAALLAGGLWWKLKNAQLGKALVQPQEKIQKPAVAQKPALTRSAITAPTAMLNRQADAGLHPAGKSETDADVDGLAVPAAAGVSPQELSKMPRVTGIRHWSSADSSTVVLDLEDQVQYEAHRLANPDRIYFDLHDTAAAPDVEGKTIEIGDELLARVRVAKQVSGLTRVVLETKGNSNYSVSLEPNPYRLLVQVRKLGADSKAQVNLFPGNGQAERERMAIVVPPPTREDLQLRARMPKMRIVVDAGHGGWDLGTVGRRGLLEKDLVLEIAQRLGKLLESRLGADVILTRNADNYIPLDERAEMANQAQADLFVSVHANYSDLPSARGVETYYTNVFSSPNAKDVESPANASQSDVTATLSPADLHERIEQSRRLAASVQRSLYGTLSVQNPGLRDRGVKEASYVVLTETAMPGILAEVSFVSSPADEQKLRSDGYREQIAEALYKGIARYAVSSHSVKMASVVK